MKQELSNYIKRVFTKKEYMGLGAILLVIFVFMFFNFSISERKARDAQRKQDIRDIANALDSYKNDIGSYPESENGMIKGCNTGRKNDLGQPILRACDWGTEGLIDPSGTKGSRYMERIPVDPRNSGGMKYYYLSDGRFFQIFAALESSGEAEYDKSIVVRGLMCGNKVCNFGLASSHTPLDKTIQEYENELDAKAVQNK